MEPPKSKDEVLKIILLGDSAVGKTKYDYSLTWLRSLVYFFLFFCRLIERFLMDN
jgi:hypothetical protein